jgi:hypothetical protein
MVYSSAGVGEASRYSRHGLHNRLYGPSEGNTLSHRRQTLCISLIFLEDNLEIGRALRAMLFPSLWIIGHSLSRSMPSECTYIPAEQMPYRLRYSS